jgi:hypothetical protein
MSHRVSFSLLSQVNAENIYKIYKDVENWPLWDASIEYSKLNGNFRTGNTIIIKPKGQAPNNTKLISVTPNQSFTIETNLPFGSKIVSQHILEKSGEMTKLTHNKYFEGIFGWFLGFILAPKFTKNLPLELQKLAKLAK